MDILSSDDHPGSVAVSRGPAPCDESLWPWAGTQFASWREDSDAAALDALVQALTPRLWQVARAYGLDTQRSEDVVQSTWLAMVSHAETIHEPRAIGAWLITATRREALRVARAVAPSLPVEDAELSRRLPDEPSAEELAMDAGDARDLWRAFADLPDRCRRILRILAFAERPNYAALADELSMPVGSIGPTRGRCLAKLRDLLGGQR